jgi:hypothetical protein
MTIRKGVDWGEPGALAPDAPVTVDDAQVALLLQDLWSPGSEPTEIGLLGGDLHTTLGAPTHDEDDLRSGAAMRFPMDLGTVSIDGAPPRVFVAHLIATTDRRGRLWNQRTVTVLNGSFAGRWNLGPRAHPNDGRLDLVDGALPPGQRRAGRRRMVTGTHVPHPDLSERRVREASVDSEVPWRIRLDDRDVGQGRSLEIRCHPDAWIAVV